MDVLFYMDDNFINNLKNQTGVTKTSELVDDAMVFYKFIYLGKLSYCYFVFC